MSWVVNMLEGVRPGFKPEMRKSAAYKCVSYMYQMASNVSIPSPIDREGYLDRFDNALHALPVEVKLCAASTSPLNSPAVSSWLFLRNSCISAL
jgi:hypothetical protein